MTSDQDSWANPSHAGADNGTDVRFVTSPATGIDFAISSPSLYCEDNPLILTNCFTAGAYNNPDAAHEYSIVGMNENVLDDPDGNINGTTAQASQPFNTGPSYNP